MIDHKKAYRVLVDGGEDLYKSVREILDRAILKDESKESTISQLKNFMTEDQAKDLYEAEFDGTSFSSSKK